MRRPAPWMWSLLCLGALAAAELPAQPVAETLSTRTCPLPVAVEGEHRATEIYLELPFLALDRPLPSGAAGAMEAAVGSAEALLAAVRRGDHSAARQWVRFDEAMGEEGIRRYFRAFAGSLKTFDDVEIVGAVPSEGALRLLVRGGAAGKRSLRIFSFVPAGAGRYLYDDKVTTGIFDSLTNALLLAGEPPCLGGPAPPPAPASALHVFELGSHESWGELTATLHLAGERVDLDLFAGGGTEDPVLSFYQKAYGKLREGDLEAFLASLTPASREVVEGGLAEMEEAHRRQYLEEIAGYRKVRYVVRGGAVDVLFFEPFEGSGGLRFEYVAQGSGGLAIANLGRGQALDEVFRSRAFQTAILRPSQGEEAR